MATAVPDATQRITEIVSALGEDALAKYRPAFEESLQILKAQAQINAPTGIGGGAGLRGSIEATPVTIGVNRIDAAVGTSIGHALPVELGTKPHWAPIAPLQDWVNHKLGISDDEGAASVAYAIQRKIGYRGTQAQPFIMPAFEQHAASVFSIMDAYTDKILNGVVNDN